MFDQSVRTLAETGDRHGNDLPLSAFSRLRSNDLDEVHAHMSAMFCRHDLHTDGGVPPIAFRHNHASLRSLSFNATDYGNPYGRVVVAIPPPSEDLCLVQISLAGRAQINHAGETFVLEPGHLCVLGSRSRTHQMFEAGFRHFTIKIPTSDLNAVLLQELGYRPGELHFSPRPIPVSGAAASFVHMIRTVCDDMDMGLPGTSHPRASGAIAGALTRLLLAAAPHNHSELFNGTASCPAPFYVRRVEEFVRAHAEEPIGLADMVAASGVSARSLHAGFRRFREVTPMGYLKNHRLGMARAMLTGRHEAGRSVTQIALACGFTHLSKFAREYFERYGEKPSETLRAH